MLQKTETLFVGLLVSTNRMIGLSWTEGFGAPNFGPLMQARPL
jgi:hypothetical protein